MKTKPRYVILFLFLLVGAASCKKDSPANSNGDSYVKFKKNGTWVTFQALGELGPDLGDPTKTNFGVTGYSTDQKEVFDFTIQVDGNSLPAGTYKSEDASAWVDMSYSIYTTDGLNDRYYDIGDVDGQPPSKYTVVITSITSTQLSGTFTGNYLTDDSSTDTPEMVQVTEGEFKVKRVR